ncbi:hypothetical protein ACFQ7F_07755 [Streptomyces sp. NPDC056486]|uniref:hypothetical protein n=1 Tax=Streptomyces sp. NPDC056486 TaxID=3345835 RepID=UPI00367C0E1B
MTTTEQPAYAPEHWLGTRLARELTGLADPLIHLYTAHEDGDPLAKFAQITASTVLELDALDAEAEGLRTQLAHRAAHGSRHLDGPYNDADAVHTTATALAQACAARQWTTTILRRLLTAYAASTP